MLCNILLKLCPLSPLPAAHRLDSLSVLPVEEQTHLLMKVSVTSTKQSVYCCLKFARMISSFNKNDSYKAMSVSYVL